MGEWRLRSRRRGQRPGFEHDWVGDLRKLLRTIVWVSLSIAIVASICGASLYQAWRHEPEFYTKALEASQQQHEIAGDELEKNVLELRNEVRREGRWEVEFTDKQINGWLAVDLPKDFSELLPRTIHDPRVAISDDEVLVACRFVDGGTSAVVSLGVDIQLTDEPNVIAVRIRRARAGRIPLPLNQFIERINKASRKTDVKLRWVQDEGDPVALIEAPVKHKAYGAHELKLEAIELNEGRLRVAGRSGSEVAADFFAGSSLADHFPRTGMLPTKHADQQASD